MRQRGVKMSGLFRKKKQDSPPRTRRAFSVTWGEEDYGATMYQLDDSHSRLHVGDEQMVRDVTPGKYDDLHLHLADGSTWHLISGVGPKPGGMIRVLTKITNLPR